MWRGDSAFVTLATLGTDSLILQVSHLLQSDSRQETTFRGTQADFTPMDSTKQQTGIDQSEGCEVT